MKNYTTLAISVLSLIVLSACGAPPSNSDAALEEAAATVDAFMNFTLGSLPGSNLDFDRANTLLTPSYEAEFIMPMSYCIQDGPSDVQITSTTFNDQQNWAIVTVEGAYYGGWRKLWDFTVVPTEGDHWMINKIECSPEMLQ